VADDVRLLPCGDTGLLLDFDSLDETLAWHATLETARLEMVEDLVPAARTVLVRMGSVATTEAARRAISALQPVAVADQVVRAAVELEVTYDGADLDEVGDLTGLGAGGVVAAHTEPLWRVAFCGFAPGFAYLVGGHERLHVPRRRQPRTRVPAGAVGLAGEFSGVYPRSSPGGWQLIGHTDAVLWDAEREPPALLPPGTTVRFSAR